MQKLKLLLIDSEGGHGGSSKSLYTTLKNVDKTDIEFSVICKKESWIKKSYEKENIKCAIFKNIPTFTCVPRLSRNIYNLFLFLFYKWPKSYYFRKELGKISHNYSLIHFNHINQFMIALWLRKINPKVKMSMHIRTTPVDTVFSRLQYSIVNKTIKNLVFITENEYDHFIKLTKANKLDKNIIFNSVENSITNKRKYSFLRKKKNLLIGSISNYSYYRGTDRIIEVLVSLPKNILSKIHVVIAGDTYIDKTARLHLKLPRKINTLEKYAKSNNIEQNFSFLGHIDDPDNLIIHLDLTLKLTRENNPWGRDVLESMHYGVPMMSIGTYNFFIKNSITGILLCKYDKKNVAKLLAEYTKNLQELKKMGRKSKRLTNLFCNPKKNGATIKTFWQKCC